MRGLINWLFPPHQCEVCVAHREYIKMMEIQHHQYVESLHRQLEYAQRSRDNEHGELIRAVRLEPRAQVETVAEPAFGGKRVNSKDWNSLRSALERSKKVSTPESDKVKEYWEKKNAETLLMVPELSNTQKDIEELER